MNYCCSEFKTEVNSKYGNIMWHEKDNGFSSWCVFYEKIEPALTEDYEITSQKQTIHAFDFDHCPFCGEKLEKKLDEDHAWELMKEVKDEITFDNPDLNEGGKK